MGDHSFVVIPVSVSTRREGQHTGADVSLVAWRPVGSVQHKKATFERSASSFDGSIASSPQKRVKALTPQKDQKRGKFSLAKNDKPRRIVQDMSRGGDGDEGESCHDKPANQHEHKKRHRRTRHGQSDHEVHMCDRDSVCEELVSLLLIHDEFYCSALSLHQVISRRILFFNSRSFPQNSSSRHQSEKMKRRGPFPHSERK